MAAYVADPDFAHSVLLNPANLVHAANVYVAGDYENFNRGEGELFLPFNSLPGFLANGKLTSWNISMAAPLEVVGVGAAFDGFELAGWRTTISAIGTGVQLPLGFSAGVTGKYITVDANPENAVPVVSSQYSVSHLTFDLGVMKRAVLADNTFFRAILSLGADFSNIVPGSAWYANGHKLYSIDLPQTISFGAAYTFVSNYRLADYDLFRVTLAADYSHVLGNSAPMDGFIVQNDQFRVGLETVALGVLAARVGYTLKTPQYSFYDPANDLTVSRMGSGFSYGFSLRFPVKLLLPDLPITSLELSYSKNPQWNSGMYHDMFGLVCEMYF